MFDPVSLIIQLVVAVVFSIASTLLKQSQQQDKKAAPGVRGTIQTGGDHPLAFIMGWYGTAGHLKYAGTWGNSGEVPNAYFSKVISVSDLPIRGYTGFFVNGERVTLAATETGSLGYAVLEYRVDGKDHLWIKPYTGDQIAVDELMYAKFGSDPDRPYTSSMIGRGVAYFVATALVNRELFPGLPEYFAEVDGIPLDDPRGNGAHDNPMVGIYTIMKGIRYNGQWVYGPQNVTDNNFYLDNLKSQMDKCDVLVAKAGGGTEKRFRFGMEVSVDTEPHVIIGEYLKACEGRVAEIGGKYKFLVGEPDAPVASITDEDVLVTEQKTYEPFPGLENLFNAVLATYPEPEETWETKEAPPRYRSDLEVLDDNRRLPFSTSYKAVPYPRQVQRLMRATIEETRRFRRDTKTMPPEWWEYEPLDSYVWTSAKNGFENKRFIITVMEDLQNGNQFVGSQELDPADYDWSSSYELPWNVYPLVISRPPPQPVSGFYVEPAVAQDSQGRDRRPAIDAFWSSASVTVDVRYVRITIALPLSEGSSLPGAMVWEGVAPRPELGSARLTEALLPNENYLVQIQYISESGRATLSSAWLAVLTPDVKYRSGLDFDPYADIDMAALGEDFTNYLAFIGEGVRSIIEQAQALSTQAADETLANYTNHRQIRQHIAITADDITASYTEAITVATGPGSAIVLRIEQLEVKIEEDIASAISLLQTEISEVDGRVTANAEAITALDTSVDNFSASGKFRVSTVSTESGAQATIGLSVATSDGATANSASLFLSALTGGKSRVAIESDQFVVRNGSAIEQPFIFESGAFRVTTAMIKDLTAGNIRANSLDATVIDVDDLFAQNAAIAGVLTVGLGLRIDGPANYILVSD